MKLAPLLLLAPLSGCLVEAVAAAPSTPVAPRFTAFGDLETLVRDARDGAVDPDAPLVQEVVPVADRLMPVTVDYLRALDWRSADARDLATDPAVEDLALALRQLGAHRDLAPLALEAEREGFEAFLARYLADAARVVDEGVRADCAVVIDDRPHGCDALALATAVLVAAEARDLLDDAR